MQFLISRAGSAGGPKPGRAGFYLELGRRCTMPLMGIFGGAPRPVVYLFVDAGHLGPNFSRAMSAWCGTPVELDFGKLRELFNAQKLFLYDCLDDSLHPNETSEQQNARIQSLETEFRHINALSNTHVRLGSISGSGKKRRQKEVDILIAVDMLNHAVRQNMNRAVLLTGDRDFTPLVEALVQFGLIVDVAGDLHGTSDILAASADNYQPLGVRTYHYLMTDAIESDSSGCHPLVMEMDTIQMMCRSHAGSRANISVPFCRRPAIAWTS